MTLELVSGPSVLPVSVAEARMQCRISVDEEDSLVESYILAALEQIERVSNRAFAPQTWRWTGDAFPAGDEIDLGIGPLVSVTSVTYTDEAGNVQTLDPAEYVLDTASIVGRIVLAGSAWPGTSAVPGAVSVVFVAGRDPVPEGIKQAIRIEVCRMYDDRAGEGGMSWGAESMISPHRRIVF